MTKEINILSSLIEQNKVASEYQMLLTLAHFGSIFLVYCVRGMHYHILMR